MSIEIEEGPERMVLTLIDTPGFHHNELDLERAVTSLVKLVGARYDETLNEVSVSLFIQWFLFSFWA